MTTARRWRKDRARSVRWVVVGGVLSAGGLSGCAKHATPLECRTLLDRYVELLVRERDPTANDGDIMRQKDLTRDKASRDASFATCPQEVTSRELGCAMGAPNVDEFEKCLE